MLVLLQLTPLLMMSAKRSTLYKTAISLISGYNEWNIDAIVAPSAPNCTQQVLPTRLGRPSMDNESYRQFFTAIMPMFKDWTFTAYDVVEDPKASKAVIHAGSTATTPLGEYKNEYMIVVETNDAHDQIVHIKEFVDSGFSEAYFVRLRDYMAAQQGKEHESTEKELQQYLKQ